MTVLKIGDIMELTGISRRLINYWREAKVFRPITPVRKGSGNACIYLLEDLKVLLLISDLHNLGLKPKAIRDCVQLCIFGGSEKKSSLSTRVSWDWEQLTARAHQLISRLDKQIAEGF